MHARILNAAGTCVWHACKAVSTFVLRDRFGEPTPTKMCTERQTLIVHVGLVGYAGSGRLVQTNMVMCVGYCRGNSHGSRVVACV